MAFVAAGAAGISSAAPSPGTIPLSGIASGTRTNALSTAAGTGGGEYIGTSSKGMTAASSIAPTM